MKSKTESFMVHYILFFKTLIQKLALSPTLALSIL